MSFLLIAVALLQDVDARPASTFMVKLDAATAVRRQEAIKKEIKSLEPALKIAEDQLAAVQSGVINRQRKTGLFKGVWITKHPPKRLRR